MFSLFQCHDLASLGATLAIDLLRDALIAAGVDSGQIYENRTSGRLDVWLAPGSRRAVTRALIKI
jgi:hypothetical protein